MIRVTRRRVLLAVLALVILAIATITWTLAGLPPIKYYVRYGLDPYCEPTGERVTYEGVEFVEIGPGVFRMGSTYLAQGGDWIGKICAPLGLPWGKRLKPSDETPAHWVEFRKGFWVATTEVTNAQYERFKPERRRSQLSQGDDTPVVEVSWKDANDFCAWLSEKSRRPIRLPSEAEWECACRAGGNGRFTFGDDEEKLSEFAWYGENSEDQARPVATKRPNNWGLFDLHGNSWEWCEDTYHPSHDGAPADGSAWTEGGEEWSPGTPYRVYRGGSFLVKAGFCRSAFRLQNTPENRFGVQGFRPAFSSPEDE